MSERLMTHPKMPGRKFNIPLDKVDRAKRDGFLTSVWMMDPDGERYAVPENEVQAALNYGLRYQNLSPVPHRRSQEELAEPQPERGLIGDIIAGMTQGGPADWRNIANALGPIAQGVSIPMKVGPAADLGVYGQWGKEAVGHMPAYLPAAGKVAEAGVAGTKLLGRGAKAAIQAEKAFAGTHPVMSTALRATALNHFLGDPLRLKERVRSWFAK